MTTDPGAQAPPIDATRRERAWQAWRDAQLGREPPRVDLSDVRAAEALAADLRARYKEHQDWRRQVNAARYAWNVPDEAKE